MNKTEGWRENQEVQNQTIKNKRLYDTTTGVTSEWVSTQIVNSTSAHLGYTAPAIYVGSRWKIQDIRQIKI